MRPHMPVVGDVVAHHRSFCWRWYPSGICAIPPGRRTHLAYKGRISSLCWTSSSHSRSRSRHLFDSHDRYFTSLGIPSLPYPVSDFSHVLRYPRRCFPLHLLRGGSPRPRRRRERGKARSVLVVPIPGMTRRDSPHSADGIFDPRESVLGSAAGPPCQLLTPPHASARSHLQDRRRDLVHRQRGHLRHRRGREVRRESVPSAPPRSCIR